MNEKWQQIPIISRKMLDSGIKKGGEGCGDVRAICADPVDSTLVMMGTASGGIYRSLDSGMSWEPCNVGYTPRGASSFAIDPHNTDRILALACNSSVLEGSHGIWLSEDRGMTWKQVLKMSNHGDSAGSEQLHFDRTRVSSEKKLCLTAYWSSETGPIFRSDDGGYTWELIDNSQSFGKGIIKTHPEKGYVYVVNESGFWRSDDKGRTFRHILCFPCTGLDVVSHLPSYVFVCSSDRIYVSRDGGESFESFEPHGIREPHLSRLKVSPAQISMMTVDQFRGPAACDWERWFSLDGGRTWKLSTLQSEKGFLPTGDRLPIVSWHAKQQKVAWSNGGEFLTKTVDGGMTWQWSSSGFCGSKTARFNFNVFDPDVLFMSIHDHNAVLTTDGCRTWEYLNIAGERYEGYFFGAYAGSRRVLFGGKAGYRFGSRTLMVSNDGGQTFKDKALVWEGTDSCIGDPSEKDILFASDLRSTDGGENWKRMDVCDGVLAFDPSTGALLGRKGSKLLISRNHGTSWTALATMEKEIGDMAACLSASRIYMVCIGRLYLLDIKDPRSPNMIDLTVRMPKDQALGAWITSVASDPFDPQVIYVTSCRGMYSTSASVMCSRDGGAKWEVLSRSPDNPDLGPDGGREALCVRVHPRTAEVYVSTDGYGFWKFGTVRQG